MYTDMWYAVCAQLCVRCIYVCSLTYKYVCVYNICTYKAVRPHFITYQRPRECFQGTGAVHPQMYVSNVCICTHKYCCAEFYFV